MTKITVSLENDEKLLRNMKRSPSIFAKWISQAVESGVFIVDKHMVDSEFQFITPRGQRTGFMARSRKQGIFLGGLSASIGPTVNYSERVFDYHRNRSNNFLDRFARLSKPDIDKEFEKAINNATKEITRT